MTSVVIVHAPEDTLPARALAEKIRQAKLDVILEKTGDEFRDAFKGVPVSIALWSPRSVGQQQMSDDVSFAKGKSKVIHALMQNAKAPPPFTTDPAIDLTGWRGEDEFAAWQQLAKEVTSKAGVAPLPPPTPRPPSGFFQPGAVAPGGAPQPAPQQQQRNAPPQQRQAPQPQRAAAPPPPRPAPAPRSAPPARDHDSGASAPKKGGGMMMIAIITFVVVAALGGGGYFFWQQQQGSTAAAAAWEEVDRNDPAALRQFINGQPGQFKDEAETALATLEQTSFDAAKEADSIEAFESFVSDFPESDHVNEANGRIAELRQIQQDQTATETLPAQGEQPAQAAPTPDATGAPVPLTPAPQQQEPAQEQPSQPSP